VADVFVGAVIEGRDDDGADEDSALWPGSYSDDGGDML
jgi:hypothetical protein